VSVFNDLIYVFGDQKRPHDAVRVVGDMQRLGVGIGPSTLDALVQALVSNGQTKLAVGNVVALCKLFSLTPSVAATNLILDSIKEPEQRILVAKELNRE